MADTVPTCMKLTVALCGVLLYRISVISAKKYWKCGFKLRVTGTDPIFTKLKLER
jgi:hypothetical protein